MKKNGRIVSMVAIIAITVLCLAATIGTVVLLNSVVKFMAVAGEPVVNEPVVVNKPVVEEPVAEPVVVVIPASKEACGYDYSIMPEGKDERGIPLADYGVDYSGKTVAGPAIVQLDSLTAIAVFPDQVYEVPEGTSTWVYVSDEACLRSQFPEFPGKTIYTIDQVEIETN